EARSVYAARRSTAEEGPGHDAGAARFFAGSGDARRAGEGSAICVLRAAEVRNQRKGGGGERPVAGGTDTGRKAAHVCGARCEAATGGGDAGVPAICRLVRPAERDARGQP